MEGRVCAKAAALIPPPGPHAADRRHTHLAARNWFWGSCSAFWMDMMCTATERASMVPTVADASSGVNTMWLGVWGCERTDVLAAE